MLEFEWDESKARSNAAIHGITFERAKRAFSDPFAVSVFDDRETYGEERLLLIGMAEGPLLFLVFAEEDDRVRLIAARRATPQEQGIYDRQHRKRP